MLNIDYKIIKSNTSGAHLGKVHTWTHTPNVFLLFLILILAENAFNNLKAACIFNVSNHAFANYYGSLIHLLNI